MRISALDNAALAQVDAVFAALRQRTPAVRIAMLASVDGRPMHCSAKDDALATRLAAMTSATLSLGSSMSSAVGAGDCQAIATFASEGLIVAQRLPGGGRPSLFVLALVASNNAHVALLLNAAHHATNELGVHLRD